MTGHTVLLYLLYCFQLLYDFIGIGKLFLEQILKINKFTDLNLGKKEKCISSLKILNPLID